MDEVNVIYGEFSPNQPRDPDGKFAGGGGAMGRHPLASTAAGAAAGALVGGLPGAAIGGLASALMSRHSAHKAAAEKQNAEAPSHDSLPEPAPSSEGEHKPGTIKQLAQEHPKTAMAVGAYVGAKVGGALPGAAYDAATSATGVSGKREHFGDATTRAVVTAPFSLAGAAAGAYAGHKLSQPNVNHALASKVASMAKRA